MKQKLIFLQALFVTTLLLIGTNTQISLPTEKVSASGFEVFESDDTIPIPEVQKFSISKISPSIPSQEFLSFGLQHQLFQNQFFKLVNLTSSELFFYVSSDKRLLIFRYLFPFHTFW